MVEMNPSDDRCIEKQRKKPTLPKATIISLFARQCSFSCFFLLLFCFDCLFLLLLLLLVLLFIYSIFCLVSLTVIFSIYRFFHYVFNADVNECEQYNKGGCSHDCINTAGSFYCKCPTGFQLNKKGICEGNTINTNVFE